MKRKLIIEGNAVYEIDEECMLRKRLDYGEDREAVIIDGSRQEKEGDRGRGQMRYSRRQ